MLIMAVVFRSKAIIIGSGPAGYTAAVYAARAALQPVLIAGPEPGGQLTVTTDVENYPGFATPIQGPRLMEEMKAQAEHVGTKIVADTLVEVDFTRRPLQMVGESGDLYFGETAIICTGAQARWLGIPGEAELRGRGVSACATCDAFFFRDKTVAVIGGGNVAVEEALALAKFARQVTLVHRRNALRAEKILQDRLLNNPKIATLWEHEAAAIHGSGDPPAVTAIELRDAKTGKRTTLLVDGVFIAIGHAPATGLFKGQLAMDDDGYILTAPDSTATSVPGVFAAGDVKDRKFRQAVTAAGMGCMASLEAERFLSVPLVQTATLENAPSEVNAGR